MSEEQKQDKIRLELRDSVILNKLCDMTGSEDGAYKGFALFYIDADGEPQNAFRFSNKATFLALEKMVYNFVEQQEILKEKP